MRVKYPVLNCKVGNKRDRYGRLLTGKVIKMTPQEVEQREILPLFNDNNRHDLDIMYKSKL